MGKKNLLPVTVTTRPNGYSVKIDGQDYMYFNETMLMVALVARLGRNTTDATDKESLLECVFNIMLGKKYAEDVDRLKKTVNMLTENYEDRISRMDDMMKQMTEVMKNYAGFCKQLDVITDLCKRMQEAYNDANKPYVEYNERIIRLDTKLLNLETPINNVYKQADMKLHEVDLLLRTVKKDERQLSERINVLLGKLNIAADRLKRNGVAADGESTASSDNDSKSVTASASNSETDTANSKAYTAQAEPEPARRRKRSRNPEADAKIEAIIARAERNELNNNE